MQYHVHNLCWTTQGDKGKVTKLKTENGVIAMKSKEKEKRALNISPRFGHNQCLLCMNEYIT